MKFLQDQEEDPNPIHNRINHLIEVHEMRNNVYQKYHTFQERMKNIFDRKVKEDDF